MNILKENIECNNDVQEIWTHIEFDEDKYNSELFSIKSEKNEIKKKQKIEEIRCRWTLFDIWNRILNNLLSWNFSDEDLKTLKSLVDNTDPSTKRIIYDDIKRIYQINSTWKNIKLDGIITEEDSKKHLKDICDKYGIDENNINNNYNGFISINMSPDNIENVLMNWYKSAFFTEHNWWNLAYFDQRLAREKKHNCVFSNIVYWSLCTTDTDMLYWWVTAWMNENLKWSLYGDCYIKLKQDVKNRCTWTLGDTFNWGPLLTYNDCLKARKIIDLLKWDMSVPYIDMQIYWWINWDDIESVHYTVFWFARKQLDEKILNKIDNMDKSCLKYKKKLYLEIPKKFQETNINDIELLHERYPNAIIDIR